MWIAACSRMRFDGESSILNNAILWGVLDIKILFQAHIFGFVCMEYVLLSWVVIMIEMLTVGAPSHP